MPVAGECMNFVACCRQCRDEVFSHPAKACLSYNIACIEDSRHKKP